MSMTIAYQWSVEEQASAKNDPLLRYDRIADTPCATPLVTSYAAATVSRMYSGRRRSPSAAWRASVHVSSISSWKSFSKLATRLSCCSSCVVQQRLASRKPALLTCTTRPSPCPSGRSLSDSVDRIWKPPTESITLQRSTTTLPVLQLERCEAHKIGKFVVSACLGCAALYLKAFREPPGIKPIDKRRRFSLPHWLILLSQGRASRRRCSEQATPHLRQHQMLHSAVR